MTPLPSSEGNSASGNPASQQPAMQRYRKFLAPGLALAIGILIIGGTIWARNNANLRSTASDAGCYGYGCQPRVRLGARLPGFGYNSPLIYGTITINRGQSIELGWTAENVDTCRADERRTSFVGLYYPPTLYPTPLQESRSFKVTCFTNNVQVARSIINVNVVTAQQASLLISKNAGFTDQEYTGGGQQHLQLAQFVINAVGSNNALINSITVIADTTMTGNSLSKVAMSIALGTEVYGKQTTVNGKLAYVFPVNYIVPSSGSSTVVITANVNERARGTIRFNVSGVDVGKPVSVPNLPVAGQQITFIGIDCIKAPCTVNKNESLRTR